MKIVVVTRHLALILFIGMIAGTAGAQVITNRTISLSQTFYVENGAASEYVDFTGSIHLLVKANPTDPILPPNPIRIHTNLVEFRGIGQTSGLEYTVNGASRSSFTVGLPNSVQFVSGYHLLPPNPIREQSLSLPISYLISINSDGVVTDAAAEITVIEGP